MNERGVHTEARIEQENGRFAVYLDIFTVDAEGQPAGALVKRIADYAHEAQAEVAAHWFLRAARRQSADPTGF